MRSYHVISEIVTYIFEAKSEIVTYIFEAKSEIVTYIFEAISEIVTYICEAISEIVTYIIGLTLARPGGTLGFSHLGAPTYNIHFFTWFLCAIGV